MQVTHATGGGVSAWLRHTEGFLVLGRLATKGSYAGKRGMIRKSTGVITKQELQTQRLSRGGAHIGL